MPVDWNEVQGLVKPSPNYEELIRRLHAVFAYPFVRKFYPHHMAAAEDYAARLLGEDTRHRYDEWCAQLIASFRRLDALGLHSYWNFFEQVAGREQLEGFVTRSEMSAGEVIGLLKYLLNWALPSKFYLREVAEETPQDLEYLSMLRQCNLRFTLDLLEYARTPAERALIANKSKVPLAYLTELTHRADFTRLPYTRGATVRNYFGAGYTNLEKLAYAHLDRLTVDIERYGQAQGKNLKIGMELDNAIRIAKIVPKVVEG
jgi:hypothetical protein